MGRVEATLLVLLIVSGGVLCCGGDPTPTPDLVGTRIAVEKAAHATMTAEMPTATVSPELSETPSPTVTSTNTATPTKTPTLTPTATPTLTPSSTPTATVVPVVMPSGWKVYQHFAQVFTVAYPPKWTIEDESKSMVTLVGPNFAAFVVGVVHPECGIADDQDPEETQRCLSLLVADMADSRDAFRLVSAEEWDDGIHRGYAIESTVTDSIYDITTIDADIFVAVPGRADIMIASSYFRTNADALSERDRQRLGIMMSTLRIGSSTPDVLTATPSVTPTSTNTPRPTATPITLNIGDWVDAKGYRVRVESAETREPITWPSELACPEPCIAVVSEVTPKVSVSYITNIVSLRLANKAGQKQHCTSVTSAWRYRNEHGLEGKPASAPIGESAWLLHLCSPSRHKDPWRKGPLFMVIDRAAIPADAADGAEGKRIRLGISVD